MKPYTSFLICDHDSVANVYINGFPLGVLSGSDFALSQMANETPTSAEKRLHGSRFETPQQFKKRLIEIINAAIPDEQ